MTAEPKLYDAPDASISKWWFARNKETGSEFLSHRNGGRWALLQIESGLLCELIESISFGNYEWQPLHLPEPEWPVVDPKPYLVYATMTDFGHETRPEWWKVLPNGWCNVGGVWVKAHRLKPVGPEISDPEGIELIKQAQQKAKEKS